MEIELIRPYGFCSGVRRIVGLIERLLRERGRLYCLGQPIHNPGEVARLEAAGLVVLADPSSLPEDGRGKPFLVRAHGLAPQLRAEVERRGYEVIDGTCPLVLAAQRRARALLEGGYRLVIVGHRGHPEVEGLRAIAAGRPEAVVTLEPGELGLEAELGRGERLGLLAQTTILPEQFAAAVAAAAPLARELKVINTLCPETIRRQEAVRRAAPTLELMLVIGGRNSSNTSRLAEIAARYTRCYHIENQNELERGWFIGRVRIGISGGTSTPEASIRAVQGEIERLMGGANDGEEDGRVRDGQ